MKTDLLKGKFVRLTAVEPKEIAEMTAYWNQDSEYLRFAMLNPANQYSVKKLTAWAEKDLEKDAKDFLFFGIRKLDSDRLIGSCGFSDEIFPHAEAFVGIGIGERELWSKGLGTDAMMVLLRYGFEELNLRRVSLSVTGNNDRAIRSYEKAGFVIEGRQRGCVLRDNQRQDEVFMGILREEWLAKSKAGN